MTYIISVIASSSSSTPSIISNLSESIYWPVICFQFLFLFHCFCIYSSLQYLLSVLQHENLFIIHFFEYLFVPHPSIYYPFIMYSSIRYLFIIHSSCLLFIIYLLSIYYVFHSLNIYHRF